MFVRSIALLVAAAVCLVHGIVNGTDRARGPASDLGPMTIGASCPAEPVCGCMPHMCTDLATIGGTATLLTYLCPEVKTVQVTATVVSTVMVTVHDGEGRLSTTATASTGDDKTTTIKETRKSTLYVTKTIQVKHSSTAGLTVTITGVIASDPAYTHVIVPQSSEVKVTALVSSHASFGNSTSSLSPHSVGGNSTSPVSVHPVPTEPANSSFSIVLSTASQGLVLTNPLRPSFSPAGIWLNSTTSDVIFLPRPSISSGTAVTSMIGLVVPTTSPTANLSDASAASNTASPIGITYLPPVGHPKPSSKVISNLESFPFIDEPTGYLDLPSDSAIFSSIFEGLTQESTVIPATLTDGTFFSSDMPAHPTALVAREQADNQTTVALQSLDAATTTDFPATTTSTEEVIPTDYNLFSWSQFESTGSVSFGFTLLLPFLSIIFATFWV
ncbi:hypothetical protein GRF29_112g220066 [Pseudopithomyces chartarum]|uniref:Uncharacterized protein n=1 Tax=Pseudopithomyces chartarum TaxID=1892770 RepID=A0AAN6RE14_9PLEO|nr:hypothetical protein GRF29_112g220066 [Pseudopithomyces chartarum]